MVFANICCAARRRAALAWVRRRFCSNSCFVPGGRESESVTFCVTLKRRLKASPSAPRVSHPRAVYVRDRSGDCVLCAPAATGSPISTPAIKRSPHRKQSRTAARARSNMYGLAKPNLIQHAALLQPDVAHFALPITRSCWPDACTRLPSKVSAGENRSTT